MKKSDIEAAIILRNNKPLEDFCGLTPTEIHNMEHHTFEHNSPLKFRDFDPEILNKIPFFRIVEELLKILEREEQIKLTPLGALPKKVVVELYRHKFILDYFIEEGISKLHREQDSIAILSARLTAELAGLAKKRHNKLSLTIKGTKLLAAEDRIKIFKLILKAFTKKFNWGYHDGYPQSPTGQYCWGYTLFLLDKFGKKERLITFYADKYLTAFPPMLGFFEEERHATAKSQFYSCYSIRSFHRFLEWYGLVTIKKEKSLFNRDKEKIKRTELLKQIFIFNQN